MPDFVSPFSGLNIDKKLSHEELLRAIRFMVAAEYEAVQMYGQIAEACADENAKKVIESIIDEEVVHAGEFLKVLTTLEPKETALYQKGMQEAGETMKILAKKVALKFSSKEDVIKHYSHDPLFKAAMDAKNKEEFDKALSILRSVRGETSFQNFITMLKK
jgi:rubrerythrin